MATIYKPKGTQYWWGRAQRDGRECRESLKTTSRAVAKQRLREMIERLDTQAWGNKPRKTYGEGMRSFVLEHLPRLKPSTQARYLVSARLLDPFFSGKHLDQITSARLAEFEAERRKGNALY